MSWKNPDMDTTTLSALAEPNRLRIIELLRNGPMTVGEIVDRLGLRQPQASKHLKVLSDTGIVEVQADANRRICRLRPEPFQAMDAWVKSFRRLWEDRFDNLDDYLRELQQKQDNQIIYNEEEELQCQTTQCFRGLKTIVCSCWSALSMRHVILCSRCLKSLSISSAGGDLEVGICRYARSISGRAAFGSSA